MFCKGAVSLVMGMSVSGGSGMMGNDGWGSVVVLGVSASVPSVGRVVVSTDSISVGTISVVGSISVVSRAAVGSDVVVCSPIVDSIVSGLSTVVGGDGVVSGLLVVGVGLFVSGTLVLSVGSYVPVLSVVGSVSSMSIMGSGSSNVVVSVSGMGSVRVKSVITMVGSSVGSISVAAGSVGTIGMSGRVVGECGSLVVAGHRVGLSCHHVFGQGDGQQSGDDEKHFHCG